MCELSEKLLKLELNEEIFKGVKYVVTGEVHEKVLDLLRCGGAERMTYFSDMTTHLIVGRNPEELDLTDANDLYEKPAVFQKWVLMCASLKRLINTKPYLYYTSKLFSNLVFCFSKIEDRSALWAIISYFGGEVHTRLTNKTNYLVTVSTDTQKYEKAISTHGRIKIVTPDWIIEAVRHKRFPDFNLFHPKLINWPKPLKPHESTAAITGFEPENTEVTVKEEKNVCDSTQALLEKLKQRMPWNQPPTTSKSTTDPVAPPNVVAPSFLNKIQSSPLPPSIPPSPRPLSQPPTPTSIPMTSPRSSPFPNIPHSPNTPQVPRSIVHHSPNAQNQQFPQSPQQQQQVQQQQVQQHAPMVMNRIIGQAQPRPMQQIRGQMNSNQLLLIQQKLQIIQQQINQIIAQGQSQPNQQLTQQQFQQLQQLRQNQLMLNTALQNHQQQVKLQQMNQIQLNQQNQQQIQMNQQNQQQQHIQQINQQNQQQQMQLNQQNQMLNPPQNQQLLNQQNQQQQLQLNQQNQQILNQQNQQQMQLNQQNQQQTQQQLQQTQQQLQQTQQQLQQTQQQQLQQGQNEFFKVQQLIQQKQQQQQLLNQQIRTSQHQQLLQNQNNLVLQQHHQNFNQNQQEGIQQQKFQPQMSQASQMNVQALNQQLSSQNLGQQLNQQQLSQQNRQIQVQQQHINQQIIQQNQLTAQQQQTQQINQIHQQLVQTSQHLAPPNQPLIQSPIQTQQNQQLSQQIGSPNQQMGPPTQPMRPPSQHVLPNQQSPMGPPTQQMGPPNQQIVPQNQQMGPPSQQMGPPSQQITSPNQQMVAQNQQIVPPNQQIGPAGHQIISQNQQIGGNQQMGAHAQQLGLGNQMIAQQNQQIPQQNLQMSAANQITHSQANIQQMAMGQQTMMMQQQQTQQHISQQTIQQNIQQQQINQQIIRTQFVGQRAGVVGHQTMINQQQVLSQQQVINQQQTINQQQVAMGNQQIMVGQQAQPRAQLPQHLWQQQQQQQQQMPGQQVIRHPPALQQGSPRIQWSPTQQPAPNVGMVPQRQYIHLDAHTHNQLQKMGPDQQVIFVENLKKQRQLQLAKQAQQQRAGGRILIRGNVPPGLTAQQQVQWLQQQAKQQGIILPPNIQQNLTPAQPVVAQQQVPVPVQQHAPGLSPINQNAAPAPPSGPPPNFDQAQQQQLQMKQYRLQQLQIQREQAQKNFLVQQQGGMPQPTQVGVVRPMGQPPAVDAAPVNQPMVPEGTMGHPLVVNAKTKTALANMLNIKLQSGGGAVGTPRPDVIPEPSAAGTLRMMTAQHNAALNSKPQEIIAMQQRRVISGPNGEIIKPPGPHLPLTPTNEPPKLQYCQPKPPLPVQHNRVGPFYGHNPNLKLPPDLFLLGCIFVVVEIEGFLEERLPGWQQKIEKHGGEVEKQYCNKVTHVLCETQRHGVVMQALRDCKRCVTILWLSDVMKRKQVLPPWTALHLPQIYLDVMPAAKHLISISGFEGNDRNRVKQMISYTGAKCTSYFSKHNTLLICAKAEGKKFEHAKKWGIPVVNVQWLTDIILGNFTALNQMDHQVYQTYSSPPNMSFDPKLVPNMMLAWKAPINISQESYERVKRAASPVSLPKAKKMKTEHIDENDNISDEPPKYPEVRILFSQFSEEETKELEKMVRELGGTIAKDHTDFSHLVMPSLTRTSKLFFAVVKSRHILTDRWLRQSHNSKQFLPETDFPIETDQFNKRFNLEIEKTLQSSNRDKLFENKCFWITPSVYLGKKMISELVQCCGGTVERIRRSAAQIEASNPMSYFIVTAQHDLHLVADLLRSKKDKLKVVCNVELIFSSILKQSVEIEPYAVSVM